MAKSKFKPDPERAAKWEARHLEWIWLSNAAHDPHVQAVCLGNADLAKTMKQFWLTGE